MKKREVIIRYRNHRGEIANRRIEPDSLYFKSTAWHPEPQWMLEAWDVDKKAYRSFAMKDILAWGVDPVSRTEESIPATHEPANDRLLWSDAQLRLAERCEEYAAYLLGKHGQSSIAFAIRDLSLLVKQRIAFDREDALQGGSDA